MMDTTGIVIADDHRLIREGIKTYLQTQEGFNVLGEAENGEQAVELALQLKPDVIIMDLNMPKMDGIQAINKLKKVSPETKIIVLTVFTQNDKVFPAINAGADGYLLKDILPEELISAIHTVMEGKPAVHPEIVQKLMMGISSTADNSKLKMLTSRETEVLYLLAEGKSNEEIARELIISVQTVKTHVHNIFTKLDMTKRVQAALFARSQPELFDEEYDM